MARVLPVAAVLALLAPALAGCLGPAGNDVVDDASVEYPRGVHPWPAGDEWPAGLEGPFWHHPMERLKIAMDDGVKLEAWLFRPVLPEDVRAPVVLWSSPYFGLIHPDPEDERFMTRMDVPVRPLVDRGFAVLAVGVRGTAGSEGCFGNKGPREQLDQVKLVEWAAAEPWSNGRVGMMGLSYPGTTPLMAAIHDPPALKTIVPMGPVTDVYTESFTPQGAPYTGASTNEAARRGLVSLASPIAGPPERLAGERAVAAGRLCEDYARVLATMPASQLGDVRDEAYWKPRQLLLKFPDVTTSVYLIHGLKEYDHPFQEDFAWDALAKAPKRMLLGQWGHQLPNTPGWFEDLAAWLDFWLKGVGAPPRLGLVDYQDGTGAWRVATSWPPPARLETLHLTPANLSREAAEGARVFRAAPWPYGATGTLCQPAASNAPFGVALMTEPLAEDLRLEGNPFAWLRLSSDMPGGQVSVHLFDVTGSLRCRHPGIPENLRLLAEGAADLRFHAGNFVGKDFPRNAPTFVRIDLTNLADVVPAGHKLALVVSHGRAVALDEPVADLTTDKRTSRSGQPYYPQITIHTGAEGSHLVLPVMQGSVGGNATGIAYPPTPFTVS
ncbi:MAG TPA: CocE/NonD family hydrolase [Candidatus Thermoplasmatota archaeon]|nr:CocE/NonD family hydrolase [Candidatus Thermoplasmatota archaeon]